MFEASKELQQQLEEFNPNKLGRLIHSIENVDDTDPNQLRKGIEKIKTQFGIDLLSIPTNHQKDALLALYFTTESVFDVANKKTTEKSTKKSKGNTPAEIILTDAQKEANKLANEKMTLSHQKRRLAEIKDKTAAKALEATQIKKSTQIAEPSLEEIENILNPRSKSERLNDKIEEFFLKPENSAINLFLVPEIRDLVLKCATWKGKIKLHKISESHPEGIFAHELHNDLCRLLADKILGEENIQFLVNKFGERLVKKQTINRVIALMDELINKTTLYSASEVYTEQEIKEGHPIAKGIGLIKNFLLGGKIF
jgi:hypothetical protein